VEMTEEYTVSFCSVEKILRVSGMCLSRNEWWLDAYKTKSPRIPPFGPRYECQNAAKKHAHDLDINDPTCQWSLIIAERIYKWELSNLKENGCKVNHDRFEDEKLARKKKKKIKI
jgi:hypothetical protein